jgi:hypothetical protein
MFKDIGCSTRLPDFDLALTTRERAIPRHPDPSMEIIHMIEDALEITKTFPFRKISPIELNDVGVNNRDVYATAGDGE